MVKPSVAAPRRAAAAQAAYHEWLTVTGQPAALLTDQPPEVQDMWTRIAVSAATRYVNYPRPHDYPKGRSPAR